MKLSRHKILVPLSFIIPLTLFLLSFSFSGSLVILTFHVMNWPTKQSKKPLLLSPTPSSLYTTTHQQYEHVAQANILTPKASRDFKQIRNHKKTYCLLDYDPVTIHLSITFIDLTQLKTQCLRHSSCLNEQDLYQWLCKCSAGSAIRQQALGCHNGSLEWLSTRPTDVVAYKKKTLLNLDA